MAHLKDLVVNGNATIVNDEYVAGNIIAKGNITTTEGFVGNLTGNVTGNLTGIASSVATSDGSSNVERKMVVANGNNLFTVPNVTANYSNGTITATKFNGQLAGTIASSTTATTQSSGDNSTKVATTAYVDTAVANLPEPMIFKGSLGTSGTITSLPTAAATNEGFTYKVITAGTYASQAAKVGDTFISDGSAWILIPSGDEPSGTVTSVKIQATSPIAIDSSDAITTSGTRTLSHANSGVSAGTYRSVTVNATGHVTAGTNPTTLSGYGITDAKINNGTITLGNNTITPLTSYTETDPVYSASAASGITSSDITNWNNKSNFSGNYNDLTNKPTIPTVNNATLTIQKNGTNVKTFTANASSDVTANITVPTKVSELTNDSGFVTTDTNNRRSFYGTCSTAADAKDKVVTLSNTTGWELLPGTIVGVKFSNTNTYSSSTSSPVTLNVNGTGAKNIWYNTTHSGAGNTGTNTGVYGVANRVYYYMYDGTYWVWLNMGGLDGNTISQIRQENGRVYAGTNGIGPYTLIALDSNNRYQSLITTATTGTGTNKTINTSAKFKLAPSIKYYNANNSATNGNLISSTYALYTATPNLDTRYSHNHTTTFTTNSPLYIECTIDSNGYWSPTTVCITQTLRSGYYYIYLGETYSTEYQLTLTTDHPVYYYDGTNLNDYTQHLLSGKQDTLVSGTNIKTINNTSLLGSGNISISSPTKTSDLMNDGEDGAHTYLANYSDDMIGVGVNDNGEFYWLEGGSPQTEHSWLPFHYLDPTPTSSNPFIVEDNPTGMYFIKATITNNEYFVYLKLNASYTGYRYINTASIIIVNNHPVSDGDVIGYVEYFSGGYARKHVLYKDSTQTSGIATSGVGYNLGVATVALSGSYNDLTDKPSIKEIYSGTGDPAADLGNDGDIYIKYSAS